MNTILEISLIVLALSIFLVFIRLLKGPTLADRVIAMDLQMANAIAFISVYSVYTNQTYFIDVAIIISLISFMGTIGFAFYLGKREIDE